MHPLVINKHALFRSSANENIVGHAQVSAHIQLLHDNADSQFMGLCHGIDDYFFTLNEDFSFVSAVYAGKDLHQRGLPGSVLTYQAKDLALVYA